MAEIVGLRGEKITLVPPDKALHLENAIRWMNDPGVISYLKLTTGVTRGMEEEWFDRVQKHDTEFVWAILDEQGHHIGFTGIHRIHWRLRLGRTGTVIGDKDAWGKGYGSDAMQIRTRFAFETLGLHRLESEADRQYRKPARPGKGRVQTRRIARKKLLWNGQWYDCVRYGILDEDYFTGGRSQE